MAAWSLSSCQDSDAKTLMIFYFESSSSSKKLSTESLMNELNRVVLEKSQFQHSPESKAQIIHI